MDVQKAARMMLNLWRSRDSTIDDTEASRDDDGVSPAHLKWMLLGVSAGYIEGEKAHRWLGYAQGILVYDHGFTLDEVKEVNRVS